jgi:hypothetical protein
MCHACTVSMRVSTVHAHAMHTPELERIKRAVLGRVELVEDREHLVRGSVMVSARIRVRGLGCRGSMGLGFVRFVISVHLDAAEVAHLAQLAAG